MRRAWLTIGLIFSVGTLVSIILYFVAPDALAFTIPLNAFSIIFMLTALFCAFALVGLVQSHRASEQKTEALANQQEENDQDRRRFLQRLDHEFKNPLTVLRAGIVNLIGDPTAEQRQTAIDSMTNQTGRLVRLTTDLRKIADLETRPLELAKTDLGEVLREVYDLIDEKAAGTRRMQLTLPQAPRPLPPISGDWDLLFLAFFNLADNAFKYSEDGDALEILAREEQDRIRVEIADAGIGIPVDGLPHVWEELYRAENGRAMAGSGLGLPLVKAIIERHNGTVTLTSRDGQGTNVTVHLPKSQPA